MAMTTVDIPQVVRGKTITGTDTSFVSRDKQFEFRSAKLDLDQLVWKRTETPPLYDVPMKEILDFLVEAGKRMHLDRNARLQAAFRAAVEVNLLSARILEHYYRVLPMSFDRERMEAEYRNTWGDDYDGWRTIVLAGGTRVRVRACSARMVHILAGNSPGVSAISIVRSSLARGVSLFKLPSNDIGTAQALLGTLADIDPGHPVVQSFSAAYWKGGDAAIEGVLYRPQFFDKIVAWGGDAAILNLQKYMGPGLEIVAMDPKVSISLIGREAFASDTTLAEVADLAAVDVGNQEGCTNSRYQFVEGGVEDADRYSEALYQALGVERPAVDIVGHAPPEEIRDSVEVLRHLEPMYRVWGDATGRGLVVRSDEPVDFHPISKTVNVIPVDDITDALRYVGVATQTVGLYPASRSGEVLDRLAVAGIQRLCALGGASAGSFGRPHDGMWLLSRMVRWVVDETVDDVPTYSQDLAV